MWNNFKKSPKKKSHTPQEKTNYKYRGKLENIEKETKKIIPKKNCFNKKTNIK